MVRRGDVNAVLNALVREGIITGTDFFVVRAEPMSVPIVSGATEVKAGAPPVRFDSEGRWRHEPRR